MPVLQAFAHYFITRHPKLINMVGAQSITLLRLSVCCVAAHCARFAQLFSVVWLRVAFAWLHVRTVA